MNLVAQSPFAGLESFVSENVALAPFTWYRIGGPARYLVRPRSIAEAQEAARRCAEAGIATAAVARTAAAKRPERKFRPSLMRFSHFAV